MVTLIASISVTFFLYKGYIRWYILLISLLSLAIIVLINPNLLSNFEKKLLRVPAGKTSITRYNQDEMAAFTSGRNKAYKTAWRLYLKSPFTGFGYDRWAKDFNKNSAGSSLHSRWLQILVETGPIGFMLYVLIYLFSFFKLINRKLFRLGAKQPLRDVLIMALVGFFLIGVTDNHGYSDRIFYLLIALITTYSEELEIPTEYAH